MKRPAALTLVGALLLATLLAGCSLLSRQPPSVDPIAMTDQVDPKTRAPLRTVEAFPAGTKELFATVRVRNPVKGTKVEARWFYDKEGTGRYHPVESAGVTFQEPGSRHVAFSLVTRDGFPAGSYKVQVFLDGEMVREKRFRVKSFNKG